LKENYDVIVVGAGPAGIFTALELSEKSDLRILVVDKGRILVDVLVRHGKIIISAKNVLLVPSYVVGEERELSATVSLLFLKKWEVNLPAILITSCFRK